MTNYTMLNVENFYENVLDAMELADLEDANKVADAIDAYVSTIDTDDVDTLVKECENEVAKCLADRKAEC